MIHAFWTTYATVLAAEVLGDKFLYTTGFLATRYRTTPMMIGIAVAFMAKMGVAVAVGDAIAVLPRLLIAVVTVAGVVGIGRRMWNEPDTGAGADDRGEHSNAEAAMVSCGSGSSGRPCGPLSPRSMSPGVGCFPALAHSPLH